MVTFVSLGLSKPFVIIDEEIPLCIGPTGLLTKICLIIPSQSFVFVCTTSVINYSSVLWVQDMPKHKNVFQKHFQQSPENCQYLHWVMMVLQGSRYISTPHQALTYILWRDTREASTARGRYNIFLTSKALLVCNLVPVKTIAGSHR